VWFSEPSIVIDTHAGLFGKIHKQTYQEEVNMASQPGEETSNIAHSMSLEWETKSLLHSYVRKNLFSVFKFAYSDCNFDIGGKVWEHYKNVMTSILTRHILVQEDKEPYMRMVYASSQRLFCDQLAQKRNAVQTQMYRSWEGT